MNTHLNYKLRDDFKKIPLNPNNKILNPEEDNSNLHISSYLLLLMLSIHSIFEGIAIGVIIDYQKLIYMIFAISFHKWVEALSVVYIF